MRNFGMRVFLRLDVPDRGPTLSLAARLGNPGSLTGPAEPDLGVEEDPAADDEVVAELLLRPDPLDVEARGGEALADVRGVPADVVALDEGPLAPLRVGDGGVLVRDLTTEVERHHHQAPAAGRGDAPQLAHGGSVVLDVFEHVRADH